jgi:hypothetical protein
MTRQRTRLSASDITRLSARSGNRGNGGTRTRSSNRKRARVRTGRSTKRMTGQSSRTSARNPARGNAASRTGGDGRASTGSYTGRFAGGSTRARTERSAWAGTFTGDKDRYFTRRPLVLRRRRETREGVGEPDGRDARNQTWTTCWRDTRRSTPRIAADPNFRFENDHNTIRPSRSIRWK